MHLVCKVMKSENKSHWIKMYIERSVEDVIHNIFHV